MMYTLSRVVLLSALLTTLAVAAGPGCPAPRPPATCTPHASRCNDGVLEICSMTGRWREVADCTLVLTSDGRPWSCVARLADDHMCLPPGEH